MLDKIKKTVSETFWYSVGNMAVKLSGLILLPLFIPSTYPSRFTGYWYSLKWSARFSSPSHPSESNELKKDIMLYRKNFIRNFNNENWIF